MMQQVNLLTDDLRPRREPLTFRQLMAAWGGFAVLLVAVSGWHGFDLWRLNATQEKSKQQWQLLQEANARLKAEAVTAADAALQAEVEALRGEQLNREQLMILLRDYATDQAEGFSGYLSDLAEYRVEDMWLSEISLQSGGRWIQLRGLTVDPARVPEFLRRLSQGESFKGHQFDAFELKEMETGLLEFDILGPEEAG